jgi:hypothetical protein
LAAQDGREGGAAALRSMREGREGEAPPCRDRGAARDKIAREGAARGWAAGIDLFRSKRCRGQNREFQCSVPHVRLP